MMNVYWKITEDKITDTKRFKLHEQKVQLPSDIMINFSYIEMKNGVCVIPVMEDGRIICIKQYRHAMKSWEYELPAGVLDLEDAVQCAQKELIEETGYKAGNIEELGVVYPSAGSTTEKIFLFLATELQYVGQNLEESEDIELCFLEKNQLVDMIISNEFRHGAGIAAVFKYVMKDSKV